MRKNFPLYEFGIINVYTVNNLLAVLKFLFLLVTFVFLSVFSVNAQVYYGCVSNDTGLIYPDNAYGSTYEPNDAQMPGVGNYCSPKYQGSCRIRSRNDCRGCGPRVNEGTNRYPDYWYYQPGARYSYVACPIDDYIPFVMLAVGGAGFLFIRKRAIQLPL